MLGGLPLNDLIRKGYKAVLFLYTLSQNNCSLKNMLLASTYKEILSAADILLFSSAIINKVIGLQLAIRLLAKYDLDSVLCNK